MKSLLLSLLVTSSLNAFALTQPPHIGPVGGEDFTQQEINRIEKLIETRIENAQDKGADSEEDQQIAMLLAVGKKASKWIEVVNATRLPGNKLDLSSGTPSTGGIPMDRPQKSSTTLIMKLYQDFLTTYSPLITDVVTSSQELPVNPPVSDLEFTKALRKLDNIYSSTIRWASRREYIPWFTNKAIYDVRGFVFLKNTPDLENILNAYPTMTDEDKAKYSSWLLGVCKNGDFGTSACKEELTKSISNNRLFAFYTRFSKYGQSMYDLFFTLKKTRPEITWNADKTVLNSPFLTPEKSDVQMWLKENIEDEWRGLGFNLNIDYKKNMSTIPRVQFKEGVTANVNELGGNLITLSAEYPIETVSQKYTIRHEYGHVLGFQDCYLEFYDTSEKVIVYYEVDVDNIMCSRNGRLKPTHIEQLQKSYK